MKRKFLSLFMALSLLCVGCGSTKEEPVPQSPEQSEMPPSAVETETVETPAVDPVLEDYLADIHVLEAPVRDYGESVSHYEVSDDFVARILYPDGDVDALDTAVEAWVQQLADEYRGESAGSSANGDSAELTVDYTAYPVGESWVSVKLTGTYNRPYIAHPVDVSASFNADRETGALLTLDDVLAEGGAEQLRQMVVQDAGVQEKDLNEHLLDQWLLTADGLEITLVRGAYLPMSAGTVVLTYGAEALEGILKTETPEQEAPAVEEPSIPAVEVPESVELDASRPMLALTFDDGPSAHTQRLLDIFAANGGKGTFYVVGNMLDGRADTLRRMASDGHEIGGHSWSHRQLTKLSEEELTDQLMNTRAKIYDITGVDARTMRPPYGSCNADVKAKAGELGIALINWSVDTLDWKYKDANIVYKAVMDGAKDGAIILCHDLHKTTVDAMERAIPDLIAQGYQLVTVTELLGGTIPGTLYFQR